MNPRLWLALIGTVVMATGCMRVAMDSGSTKTKIHYIPLAITTYTAVTPDNIEGEGSCVLASSAEKFNWIFDLHGQINGSFDRSNVRVKIQLAEDVFVDSSGSILLPDGRVVTSPEAKARLTATLEDLRKDSACTRFDWLDD